MQDRYLIDKSALARWTKPSVKEVLKPLHERYLLDGQNEQLTGKPA